MVRLSDVEFRCGSPWYAAVGDVVAWRIGAFLRVPGEGVARRLGTGYCSVSEEAIASLGAGEAVRAAMREGLEALCAGLLTHGVVAPPVDVAGEVFAPLPMVAPQGWGASGA